MNSVSRGKIANIEFLRGIASLGVCLVHLQIFSNYTLFPIVDKLINAGQLGVYIFFILSGFILPYSLYRNNYRLNDFFNFLLKRNLRIDPPYLITLICSILFLNTSQFNIANFIYNIFYLVPFVKGAHWYNEIFWTLGIEMQFYIVLGLLFPLFKQTSPTITLWILVTLFHLIIYIQFGHGRDFLVENLTFFIVGIITFLVHKRLINFKIGIIVLIVLCIEWSFWVAIRYTLIAVPTVALILFGKPFMQNINFFMGKISYSLYLTHIFIASLTIGPLMSLHFSPASCFIIQLSFSIITATLFHQLIEKYFIRLSKKIPYHRDKEKSSSLF